MTADVRSELEAFLIRFDATEYMKLRRRRAMRRSTQYLRPRGPKQARFVDLNEQGLSAREIAEELGVSARTVVRWRTESGLEGKHRKVAPETMEQARRLIETGVTPFAASRVLGIDYHTIGRHFPDLALKPKCVFPGCELATERSNRRLCEGHRAENDYCTKCERVLPLSEFYVLKEGHYKYCKACAKAKSLEYFRKGKAARA